ncbi:tRNA (adenosine(37)-N6)-dimethylallyltransferase MiaA [Paenibacillus thermoaerophilus]|uniref:tRNA dimethylallyltransferase n=1 Tax=Paenibacillus thermoaerophilus TaxID=1215385 RepID=A0ABW2V7H5_9BACL|nr:tRNA (adenosine(37)-N6)-dimethylallyltransferase MiaA [Paenibacillus thermoaerophilus]TMV17113.1 tRNA (adenosine(37)-N6)-dimethylallyltransferase MiaA [Paenibacillus thermoaerophilus]
MTMDKPDGKPPLLAIVGPTAVGKTALSLTLAERLNGEIVSGDSMQVYRRMDIGTAKATPAERARVRHHLIDIKNPDEPFSVAEFQTLARKAIEDIGSRGKLPILVGGTGLYVESLCYGYDFPERATDEAYREKLREYGREHGTQALWDKLREVDPDTAGRLHANDERRIIRALEVYHATGERLSDQLRKQRRESPYRLCLIGLTMEREQLYRRIGERVDAMIREGLVGEVRSLLAAGWPPNATAFQGIGYKEIVPYLEGRMSLEEAVELLKRDTRRFAKRQLSWFRHMKEIEWVDVTRIENFTAHLERIHAIIASKLGIVGDRGR